MRAAVSYLYKVIAIVCGTQMGKALALDTPLPSPGGWLTMGDVAIGDVLFDETGAPCRVIAKSPVQRDRKCFRVEFCDGTAIVADADHLWHTVDRKGRWNNSLTTTLQMYWRLIAAPAAAQDRIPVCGQLQLAPSNLPMDPYVLGAWLGDGTSSKPEITADARDGMLDTLQAVLGPLRTAVARGNIITIVLPATQPILRMLDVHKNKHIPMKYLRGSIAQRVALLQGMMDTDGTVTVAGQAEYCSVRERLARDFADLAASLGYKPVISISDAKLYGRKVSDRFRVRFTAYADDRLFRLERKQARLTARTGRTRRTEARRRSVVRVVPVESVPVQCIAVDSPMRLYLAGRSMVPTHNSANLFNLGGELIDNAPQPFLWIGPTKSNITNVIVPQFQAMLDGCASLKRKLMSGRQPSLMRRIANTTVRFAWAGSATEIASQPAHTVVVDEVDKCPPIPGHGSVLIQAAARISNYVQAGGILVATSSPTEGSVDTAVDPVTGLEHFTVAKPEDLASEMWKTWQEGTRHEFMVPCPSCGEYFSPRLKYLQGWDSGASPSQAKRKAKLLHWKCGELIEPRHKHWMVSNGRAVAPGQRVVDGVVVGDPPESDTYSIWISGLCSPWVSWADRAYAWVKAVRSHDPETIRGVINLDFGEMFREKGEAPPWEDILKLSTDSMYDLGVVPKGHRKLFLTCDVQKDHLVVVVRSWGLEMESWLVLREELWGDTADPEVWKRLDELADKPVDGETIEAFAVDAGYRTEQVLVWCEKRKGRAYATRGKDKPSKLWHATDVETLRNGKKVKRGMKYWIFDHGYMKGWVHDRLKWPQDAPGAWHLPRAIGEDYCRQIVAEQRMRLASGSVHWVKTGTNDWLDAEALQALLAHIEGVRYLKPDDQPPPAPKARGVRSGGVNI